MLCRNTPDGVGHTWGDAVAWQQRLLAALNPRADTTGFPAPDAARLTRWLAGREPLVAGPRTAPWQGEWKQAWDGEQTPVGPVFVLRIPPTGTVTAATITVEVAGAGPVTIDVGADGRIEAEAKPGEAAAVAWSEAIGACTWSGTPRPAGAWTAT